MLKNWQAMREDGKKREIFFARAGVISLIRDFFTGKGFLEAETPSIVRFPGMEPYLDPVKVDLPSGAGENAYLITSPEYAMKKLLAAGFPKIFQICKSFRGGETPDRLHNQEFTMLEWYRAEAGYMEIMDDTENLFLHILEHLPAKISGLKTKNLNLGKNCILYQNKKIDLSSPWPRLTMKEAFLKYAKINLDEVTDMASIAAVATARGYAVGEDDKFVDIFFKIFLSEIEPRLSEDGRPVILYDWPAELAALSRVKDDDPRYAERFEVYIGGLEIGNAFSELTDWREQEKRLLGEMEERRASGKEVYAIDDDFIAALKEGMPRSGGIAVGVDRAVMLFTDAKSIEEVLFFPDKEIFNNK